ncbi:NAD(P)/FAD-dependent oxidoreductase [Actinomadura barringtoniae]|uniref:NAD(P)/FAD-dependent oxidoreductase n=1 Tax=Actinomadura barringtoniae TaxID=1427535 RepID=A0A939T350_9ACTN|nr:NAD(P)/FAD-dependent oxidoreductase [Actinomadura barringtoniae]MBO2446154.1 NAD(P)/FAD-dependent oxidoreductase [Actinomadura barringtoniae]
MNDVYDVVVVGGGAGGLSGALVLSRARRRVAVVDAGSPRNAPAEHMHGYLSRDGMAPGDLLKVGRGEVEGYGGEVIDDRVVGIDPGFFVRLESGRVLRARRILVASGLKDVLPDVPGLQEGWGKTVLHCPYCHGWEVRDRPVGVLAHPEVYGSGMVLHQVELVRQWSDDVVFFPRGYELSDEERQRLAARDIRVVEGVVAAVEDGSVRMSDGNAVEREAVFVAPRFVPNDELLRELGCEVEVDVENGQVQVDAFGRTSEFGVWAVGNVVDPMAQVISAAAGGVKAAAALNADLVQEDIERAVEQHRKHGL